MPSWYALTVPQIETLPIPPTSPWGKMKSLDFQSLDLSHQSKIIKFWKGQNTASEMASSWMPTYHLWEDGTLLVIHTHTCVCWGEDKGLLKALAMIRLISTPVLFLTHIDLSHWMACSGSVGFSQASSSSQMWRGGGGRMNSGRKWPIIKIVQWATIRTHLIFISLSEVQECL